MKRMKCLSVVLLISFLYCSTITAQTEKNVIISVINIPTKTGKILVATADRKFYSMADVTNSKVDIKLENIPNGKYKLDVFHDANNNWKLDKVDDVPSEYCATQDIEITDSTKNILVTLVNVKDKIEKNRKQLNNKQL